MRSELRARRFARDGFDVWARDGLRHRARHPSLRAHLCHGPVDGGKAARTFRRRAIHRGASGEAAHAMNAASPGWIPLGFHEWPPVAQATTLGLVTFVQEDVPTVTGALLASAGSLSWTTSFLGVFLGIWIGDAMLYLLARGVGRPLLQRSWSKRFFDASAVARSERWFGNKGTWL